MSCLTCLPVINNGASESFEQILNIRKKPHPLKTIILIYSLIIEVRRGMIWSNSPFVYTVMIIHIDVRYV